MAQALTLALDIVERVDAARGIPEACRVFFDALVPYGARSLMVQDTRVTAALPGSRFAVPAVCAIAPRGWVGSSEAAFINANNPNPAAGLRLGRPFQWREAKQPTRALDGTYWEALEAHGGENGICVPVFGRVQFLAGVSMAFGRRSFDRIAQRAIEISTYALLERLTQLAPAKPVSRPRLSKRERDCIAFVAEGKSDWEISVILGIGAATVHTYVEQGKRKLGAHTRAQAVAHALALNLI